MRLALLAAAALAIVGCSKQDEPKPVPDLQLAPIVEPVPGDPQPVPIIMPEDVPAKLAGKWQSIDDPNSILTITADGSWTNDYTGDDSVHDVAKWTVFRGYQREDELAAFNLKQTALYIEVISGDDKFHYELGSIGADEFDMFYVSRGNRLAYKRIG